MIKKDIAYGPINVNRDEETISHAVDEIFAAADLEIDRQNKASAIEFKEKKKHKHPILRLVLPLILIAVVLLGVFVYMAVGVFNTMYSEMRSNLLSQFQVMQDELLALDDSTLTVDQYYQKQIMLLFSTEDLEKAMDSIGSIAALKQLIESGGSIDVNVLPKDKIDEYNRLIAEYERALQETATGPIEDAASDAFTAATDPT